MNKIYHDIINYIFDTTEYNFLYSKEFPLLYPLDYDFFMRHESRFYGLKDTDGIPLAPYKSTGPQYNPTRVAGFGIAHWNRFQFLNKSNYYDNFFKTVLWFYNQPNGLFYYNFNWDDMRAPWLSCMAQGQGISLLVRAYLTTGNESYLKQAQNASIPFFISIEKGGVQSVINDNDIFFEEYPGSITANVLNGCLYGVIGLIDLNNVQKDPQLSHLLDGIKNTLNKNIKLWDTGYWSSYCLSHYKDDGRPNLSTVSYHAMHISQLLFIARHFNSDILMQQALLWKKQKTFLLNRLRALWGKVKYRKTHKAQR